MEQVTTIGLDLAKNGFQLHGVVAAGDVLLRKQSRRGDVLRFFGGLSPCLVGMEACATGHYWARELAKSGHTVRLMPPAYVKPHVKRGKTDAADAEAIAEAVTRPTMRFVAVTTAEQQAVLMLHKARDRLGRQRTMLINALRGHLAEFGIIAARGPAGVTAAIVALHETQCGGGAVHTWTPFVRQPEPLSIGAHADQNPWRIRVFVGGTARAAAECGQSGRNRQKVHRHGSVFPYGRTPVSGGCPRRLLLLR